MPFTNFFTGPFLRNVIRSVSDRRNGGKKARKNTKCLCCSVALSVNIRGDVSTCYMFTDTN